MNTFKNKTVMLAENSYQDAQRIIAPSCREQLRTFYPFKPTREGGNVNLAMSGSSGAGKSFLTKAIIHQVLADKGQVCVIDIGTDYKKLCEILGGVYLDLSTLPLNPFIYVNDIDVSLERLCHFFAYIASPIEQHFLPGDDNYQRLRQAIRIAFTRHGNHTTVDDVVMALKSASPADSMPGSNAIIAALKPYGRTGRYGRYFNNKKRLPFEGNRFVVFNFDVLPCRPTVDGATFMLALTTIMSEMMAQQASDSQTLCVMDEVLWPLSSDHPSMTAFFSNVLEWAPHYNASCVVIAQRMADFQDNATLRAVWEHSEKLLMREYWELRKSIGAHLSTNELRLFKKISGPFNHDVGHTEFVLCKGNTSSLHRFSVNKISRALYRGSLHDEACLERYRKQGMSWTDAFNQLLDGAINRGDVTCRH